MTSEKKRPGPWLERSANEPYAYLTTVGRRTGSPHRIEIWFAVEGERVYLMAGGRDRSDWVRNVKANPRVTLEIGDKTRAGTASIVEPDAPEDQRARDLLVAKYATPTNLLVDWKRRSLPVTIEFPPDGIGPATPACESECTSRSRPPAAPSKP